MEDKITKLEVAEVEKELTDEQQDAKDNAVLELAGIQGEIEALEVVAKPQTSKKYAVAANEKDLYHVKMLKGKRYDSDTGVEISKAFVQKFTAAEFKAFEPFATKLGYKYEILSGPTKTV